jgi:TetR/AcrR family transcriptional regulator of autoinduction and epiphytic fitness
VTVELVDGRFARSARTRTAVIDALLALHQEGDLNPTAVRVAGRAGVALRTVYGHFADMESLFAEAGDRELSKVIALTDAISCALPLEERVARLAATRSRVLEAMLATMRAAALREGLSRQLQENRDRFVAAGDAQVRQVLGPELRRLSELDRAMVVNLVHHVAGGHAWVSLRIDRGLGVPDAHRVLHRALRVVLADAFRTGGCNDRPVERTRL